VADQARGFSLGAVDYIPKPFELPLVIARVRTHLNLKLRTDLLEAQASIDALTGIANRRRFDEALRTEWRRAARNIMPLSLLIFDVDHFKNYNDQYGHGAGDDCLRHIGEALQRAELRPGDFVARYGGEEFAVILPSCHSAGARAIAERIRGVIEGLQIRHEHSSCASVVTVSIGCATQKPAQGGDVSGLFLAADMALYRAKQEGRNRVCTAAL
jgi:diguanylate cyclase (GGDEF)-like protein